MSYIKEIYKKYIKKYNNLIQLINLYILANLNKTIFIKIGFKYSE